MMLVYPELNLSFEFGENGVYSLIVEKPKIFRELIMDLQAQFEGKEGKFVLSENFEPIDISKNVELVSQFVPFSANRKDLLTKVYASMQKCAIEEMPEKTYDILAELEKYVMELSEFYTGELISSNTLDIVPILKMFDLKFDDEDKGLCERLLDFICAVEEYKGNRLFITVNLRSYLGDDEAELLFGDLILRKTKLLCIESSARKKLSYERRTIIDNDLCII